MAIIHVAGPIGNIVYVPPDPAIQKEAILNVGIREIAWREGHKTRWYQACWTGREAEVKYKIIDKVKFLSVCGREDFRVRMDKKDSKVTIERVVWVISEVIGWKDRGQVQMKMDLDQ